MERASAARPICGHLKALEPGVQVRKAEEQERKAAALEAEAGKAAKEQAARVVLKMQRDRVPAVAGKPRAERKVEVEAGGGAAGPKFPVNIREWQLIGCGRGPRPGRAARPPGTCACGASELLGALCAVR